MDDTTHTAPLTSISDDEALASYLQCAREALAATVRAGRGGTDAVVAYSDLMDAVIRRMLGIACERNGRVATEPLPLCIVATGGYGRRELCPHSDIDITFIPYRDGDPLIDRIIKEMFTLVMRVFIDSTGLEVGYAYRLMEDCGQLDHQTASGLLDARLIAGSDRLFIQFEHEFWNSLNPTEFIFTKMDERRRQIARFGDSARVVEPNLKEGAGGLRDLQTAVWVTQARCGLVAARARGERVAEVLSRHGWATEAEARGLLEAKEFLFRVRNVLHVLTGAERDELVVTRQEEVANVLGYAPVAERIADDSPWSSAALATAPPVERFMRDYYGHAATIHRIANSVVRRTENGRMLLGIGLDCERREVVPANEALASDDPTWMLWAFELAQRYGLGISDDLERAVTGLLATKPAIQDPQQAAQVFTRILTARDGCYAVLQRMADLGILGWLLPEFGAVMDLIPYDPSHDLTVGQHSLHVVRNLDALRGTDGPEDLRDFRLAFSELPHPEQLYLAALVHDAGKITDARAHSDTGAALAEEVCVRLGWDASATDNVRFLVEHHLIMSETSRLRDLNLDETIREFTATVDDLDRLKMLYLLTYADTSAVGAGVWTQVKGRFLRDLYHRAERMLAGEEEEDDAGLARARRRLLKELSVENLPDDEIAQHVEGMPATYLLNTSLADMALHIGYVRRARAGEPAVDFHDERNATYTEVTVCTLDDPVPGLLSKIAGVLYACDLECHSAQVYTRVAGDERIALDTLFVDFRGRQLTPGKRREVAASMVSVLTGEMDVATLIAKRRKSAEIGGPVRRMELRNDLSGMYTVVELASDDERGVLFRASAALSALRWDIHSAKLSRFRGHPVACFYVTGARHLGEDQALCALRDLMPVSPS